MKRVLLIICVLFAASVALSARQSETAVAGVEGKWVGQQQTPNGTHQVTLELKIAGDKNDKLTGTLTNEQTGAVPISDGKVKKNKVNFTTTINFNGFEANLLWSGELKDGQLTLSIDLSSLSAGGGMQLPSLVMKRAE